METERALPHPLSRRLRLVAARERGVGPEQLGWIGTDPDLFEVFYRAHVEDLLDQEDAARMDARIDAAAQSRHLYAAMDRLPEAERAVLELVALDELTVAEAAAAVGVRAVTARVRLHRARRRLGDELEAAASTAKEVDGS